jgi:hypothetical protein
MNLPRHVPEVAEVNRQMQKDSYLPTLIELLPLMRLAAKIFPAAHER